MKRVFEYLIVASLMVAAGCGADRSEVQADGSVSAEGDAPSEVCSAVDALDESLDTLEDSESMEEYQAAYDEVQGDFQTLRAADGGQHAAELDAFESAMTEFEGSLSSLGDAGLISGLIELADDAAELAVAGDRLDDAIDCPGT